MTIQDLKTNNLILFEVISGSQAFGLTTEPHEMDIQGVYYIPKEDFFGLNHISQISNEINTVTYYEIGRFIELLQKNNAKILEVLASPEDCILLKHPLMDLLKPEYFLSKLCKETFSDLVISQIKNVTGPNKTILNPVEKEKKSILDFCSILENDRSFPLKEWLSKNRKVQQKCGLVRIDTIKGMYALFYDESGTVGYQGIIENEDSSELSVSAISKEEKPIAYLFYNQEVYHTYCKDYREYWKWVSDYREYLKWVTERNENQSHGQNYDREHMMHTIRLLQSCEHIFKTDSMPICVENRNELLDIKAGNWSYQKVMKKAEDLIKSIEHYYSLSSLPYEPDLKKTTKILIEIREILYNYNTSH